MTQPVHPAQTSKEKAVARTGSSTSLVSERLHPVGRCLVLRFSANIVFGSIYEHPALEEPVRLHLIHLEHRELPEFSPDISQSQRSRVTTARWCNPAKATCPVREGQHAILEARPSQYIDVARTESYTERPECRLS